jgi:rhomboid protease GluP
VGTPACTLTGIKDTYTFLLEADRPDLVTATRDALEEAGIPFRSGLLAGKRPSVIFSVPRDRIEQAREAVGEALYERRALEAPARFPRGPVLAAGALIALHFLIVLSMIGSADHGRAVVVDYALLRGGTLDQPWRLVTSLFLHGDLTHAFWNGASLLVFSVSLLSQLGYVRTAMIYLASGVGGGLMALKFVSAGTLIIGCSGAVAGLFGAWVVLTLSRSHLEPLTGRARIRALGVAMLVLPSLLTPISATGQAVSVSSHLGGLATGMAIGASISLGLLRRWAAAAG